MSKGNQLLTSSTSFSHYAKFLPHLGRRETLEETINRNMYMHLDRFPKISKDIVKAYQRVHDLKAMPSMRALQFSGEAIVKNNARQYNCSFVNVNYPGVFNEILYLLLSGVGVGFSVQSHHIRNLPEIQLPREEGEFIVHDSIQGWAQTVETLFDAYFNGRIKPQFNFTRVRPKGAYLVTTGAKAPGPEPLRKMLEEVEARLKLSVGKRLSSLELHDIICIISDAVLAGGIRRAALISLFDANDESMLRSKHGEWWVKHPYRARANNSAVLVRNEVKKDQFEYIYDMCIQSYAGEPGFFWTNDKDLGTNPCAEISLNSHQFCNLTTINQTGIKDKKDFLNRVYAAGLIGTLQASYTEFPYLTPKWKETTEREALLGVSFTGIADSPGLVTADWLQEGAELVRSVNQQYAKKIGSNPAARLTAIKPEGTASCVLGSSSGIHARFAPHYLRRIRLNKDNALAQYFKNIIPDLVEDDVTSSNTSVITIPQKSPKGSIVRADETALDSFNRVLFYNENWIKPGHVSGVNNHNVSVTINYKPEEVDGLRKKLWQERTRYSAVSLLPYDGGSYKQAPFEECSEETYLKYEELVKEVDLRQVKEYEDKTERVESIACAGNSCEWTGDKS
jgi:ribonucleoside-triphosphate reductase (thioredoxin)